MALIIQHALLQVGVRIPDLRLQQATGLVLLMLLCGCGESSSDRSAAAWRDDADPVEAWAARDDEREEDGSAISHEEALERAVAEHGGVTYDDLGRPYGCTEDCSGHEAGVAWAQDNDIHDPLDCGGRSRSFTEGCEAYAESVQREAEGIADDGY